MIPDSHRFPDRADLALADEGLRLALDRARQGFIGNRRRAVDALPEFQALREAARRIKDHTLSNLDLYLERFESRVTASGGQVHWAADASEARARILDICRRVGARTVTKGKSMVGRRSASTRRSRKRTSRSSRPTSASTSSSSRARPRATSSPPRSTRPARRSATSSRSTTLPSASARPASGTRTW